MFFDALTQKFEDVFKRLRGQHKLSEENIKEALRDVRLALLEADVNYRVVKDFIQSVQARALGAETLRGVDPAQQFIHIVYTELVKMLGGAAPEEEAPAAQGASAAPQGEAAAKTEEPQAPAPPAAPPKPVFEIQPGRMTTILMLGLQGSGKTTFCGKLARRLQKAKFRPMLVACDLVRPAAIEQLKVVARTVGAPCFAMGVEPPAVEIVRAAREEAARQGNDVLIVDTAGRLHIDEVRMDELRAIKEELRPDYTFLVCDAMTGQDAVTSATTFQREVGLDGVCLTKMDGDARGGAALSIRSVTGAPIVFIGTGEHPEDLEEFAPDRVASRILGMGDVVSLVEKAQQVIDAEQAQEMQRKIAERKFDFNDFISQMRMVKRMGPLKGLLSLIPGMRQLLGEVDGDELEGELKRVEAIIHSMTPAERADDALLRASGTRRMRVAKGSGSTLKEVTELIRQFDQAKGMMQAMMTGGLGGLGCLMRGGRGQPPAGAPPPGMGLPPEAMGMMDPEALAAAGAMGRPGYGGPQPGGRRATPGAGPFQKRKKKKKRKGR